MSINGLKRGAFIVFEGCDRSGKSTQCRKLADKLQQLGYSIQQIQFPDRSTATGKIINEYLANRAELSDQAVHLLFSANRWESEQKMRKLLHEGVTLIADRYSYSGVAYSSAKPGMDMEWCIKPEVGLPKPDVVFFLNLTPKSGSERGGFGSERYEKNEFQQSVLDNYLKMKDKTWMVVDADRGKDEIHNELLKHALDAIKKAEADSLKTLW